MAVPQDPYFWKRFSTAVHQDEEAAQISQKPESWHTRTVRKNRGSHLRICLTFWILLFALIAIVVVVFLVLVKTGVFNKIHIGGEGHKVDVGGFQGWLNRIFGTGGGGDAEKSGSGSDGSSGDARRRLLRV